MDKQHRAFGQAIVIDDEADIRMIAKLILNREGFETRTASDLSEAMDALCSSEEACLIILDVNLGTGNGLDLLGTEELKAHDHVVIVCSASEGIEEEALNKGASFFMKKPLTAEALHEALHSLRLR